MEDSKLTFAKDETTNEIRFKLETEGRTFTKETATFGFEINGKAKKTMAATYWKPKVSSGLFTNIDLFRFFHLNVLFNAIGSVCACMCTFLNWSFPIWFNVFKKVKTFKFDLKVLLIFKSKLYQNCISLKLNCDKNGFSRSEWAHFESSETLEPVL